MNDGLDENLETYVCLFKEAYVEQRRQSRPDARGGIPSSRDEDVIRIAAALKKRNGDPRSYMQYVFDAANLHGQDVAYLNCILSEKMVNKYFESRGPRRAELQMLMKMQGDELEAALKSGRSLREILTDPLSQMGVVFRYAAARAAGDEQLASQFEKEARRMLLVEPIYRELFSKWIPEDMR